MIPQEELEKTARDLEYGDSKTGGREYDAFIAGARYAEEYYGEGPIPEKEPETWYVDVKTGYIWKPHFRKDWWTSPSTHELRPDWDIQRGINMGFLKLYEHKDRIEASLPKEEDIHLFLLSNTPYPGKYGNSFRIRSDFKLLEKEILVNSHCKEIEIIVLGEAEGGYWCRFYNADPHSYIPPECFEFPWVKGNI